ncbi:MAG: transcriptional regulator [Haloarculaceae archaeon]
MLGHYREKGATDDALEALTHPCRRRILFRLYEEHRNTDAEWLEQDDFVEFRDEWAELYHVHLPKLADEGYVRWDREQGTVTTGPHWEDIEPLLRVIEDNLNELPAHMRGTPSLA